MDLAHVLGDWRMRANDGRKLDHGTLEALRLRAVDRVEQGADPREVARTLGMHEQTVYGWVATARAGGREALKAKPIPELLTWLVADRATSP
jgi:transposase-like protein